MRTVAEHRHVALVGGQAPEGPPVRSVTYPLEPFARALGISFAEASDFRGNQHTERDGEESTPRAVLAELCGVSARTVHRWWADGIPAARVDDLACRVAGVHPQSIWPEYPIHEEADVSAVQPPKDPAPRVEVVLDTGDVWALSNDLGFTLSRMVRHGVEIRPSLLDLFRRLASARMELEA